MAWVLFQVDSHRIKLGSLRLFAHLDMLQCLSSQLQYLAYCRIENEVVDGCIIP